MHTGIQLMSARQVMQRKQRMQSIRIPRVMHEMKAKQVQKISPALWAAGGLGVVSIKLPLSLPSPRASNPEVLDDSWV